MWETIATLEFPVIVALIGAWFKIRSDLLGMRTIAEREKERNDDLSAIERDAKQAAAIGTAVAKALGRLGGSP
jgi:hypothetical protein